MVSKKSKTVEKPTIKKAANKTAKKTIDKKTPIKKNKSTQEKIKVTAEQRHKMICEAAYYASLHRGYENVNPTDDWFQAEIAINKICTTHAN